MQQDKPILIAGGGIGGLAAALGLAQKGFRATVLERAPVLGEIGAGIHGQSRGCPEVMRSGLVQTDKGALLALESEAPVSV